MNQSFWIATASIATAFVFLVLTIRYLVRYFVYPLYDLSPSSGDSNNRWIRLLLWIGGDRAIVRTRTTFLFRRLILAFLLSRIAIFLIGLIGASIEGQLNEYLTFPRRIWVPWDAPHYMGIAENGYVTEGDARFHIVFYPFYPLLVRIVAALFRVSTVASGFIVSNLCLLGAGYFLVRLVAAQYGRRPAFRALWLFMFSPVSVFFSIPYSESLFVCLALLSAWCAQKHRFGWSIFWGALCAFTRAIGPVCAVPLFYEMMKVARQRADTAFPPHSRAHQKCLARHVTRYFFMACLILSGTAAYLLLNYVVTGDALRFLTYQKEHWGQSFGSMFATIRYTIQYLYTKLGEWEGLGIWFTQLLAIILTVTLMAASSRRLRAAEGAYSLVYVFITLAPTFLLSGARYLGGMYTL